MKTHRGSGAIDRGVMESIIGGSFDCPAGMTPAEVTRELLPLLGSADSHLREGALEILSHWGEAGRFDDRELRDLGERMSVNLGVGIGESGTDTVFLRSFSALILEMVVIADALRDAGAVAGTPPLLSRDAVLRWFERALAAFAGEQDFRGCTERNGWAHALAHMSDLLGALARSPHLERTHLERILSAVAEKLIAPTDTVLLFEEDHRMIRGAVMHALLRNEIEPPFLHAWIDKLAHRPDGTSWGTVFGADSCDQAGESSSHERSELPARLYFVLTWGMTNAPYPAQAGKAFSTYYDRPLAARDALLTGITAALKSMNRPMYRAEQGTAS